MQGGKRSRDKYAKILSSRRLTGVLLKFKCYAVKTPPGRENQAPVPADVFQLPAHRQALNVVCHLAGHPKNRGKTRY